MIDADDFSGLESLIRWGCTDPLRQMAFVKLLHSSPALATDEEESGISLLMIAAEAANLEAVRQLCLLGSNVGTLSSTGDTPLLCAVRGAFDDSPGSGSPDARVATIDTLLQYGANPNQLGWQGCSALHFAVIYGLTDCVRRLLLGGGDPLIRLCDPPSDENAIELAESYRFQGGDQQRHTILALLKNV